MTTWDLPRTRVVLVTGLSGAGKASILRALEDLGYEAVDNPPLPLIDQLIDRRCGPASADERRIAVGVDARSRGFDAEAVLATLARLRADPGLIAELLFAWAEDGILLRRYTRSRRRHPLAPYGKVTEGIVAERSLTASLRNAADHLIDTSDLSPSSLRQTIERRFGQPWACSRTGLSLSLVSFAFPEGLPREADMVFDVRFLVNPHYVLDLQAKTGLDPEVDAYVATDPEFRPFLNRLFDMLTSLLPRFVQEGKKYVTIGIGCTGGRHRSVCVAEELAKRLAEAAWNVTVTHRELALEGLEYQGRAAQRRYTAELPPNQAQEA